MKKIIKVLLLVSFFVFFAFTEKIKAEEVALVEPTIIHLTLNTNTGPIYDQDITVNPCNSDNNTTIELKTTAYCAILQTNLPNEWNWSWPPGAFLNSLNNIAGFTSKDKDNNDVYHYWSWSLNSNFASVALNQYELQNNDLITLTLVDPIEPEPEPIITAPIQPRGGGAAFIQTTTPTEITKPIFNLKKATDFLLSQQKENGSFGEDLYTDWITLALFSNPETPKLNLEKISNFLLKNKFSGNLLTDYERHAIALMAVNLNPYDVNNENYIQKIISTFDGQQFGDFEKNNDDIFALIVLQNAGYGKEDEIIVKTKDFIISQQKENGSWDESIDMTGATIEALAFLKQEEKVKNSLDKAKEFLKQKQKDLGGWENVSSTAWAIEGIIALGEKPTDWIKNGNNPLDYLASQQDIDGGIKGSNSNNRIWETAYVITSLSDKSWNQIMKKFEKIIILGKNENAPIIKIEKKLQKSTQKNTIEKITKNSTENLANSISANLVPIKNEDKKIKKQNWFTKIFTKIFVF